MSSIIPAIDVSSSALTAERARLDVIGQNIANSETTKDATGQVYHRKQVVFETMLDQSAAAGGIANAKVSATKIVDDPRPLQQVHMPGHPDADANGMVTMPNVNVMEEMVDMMTASRSFEANLQVISTAKQMFNGSLNIGQA